MLGSGKMHGVVFLAGTDVQQVDRRIGVCVVEFLLKFRRGDLHGAVFLLTGLQKSGDFPEIHVRVAGADGGERFSGRKAAGTATADVVLAEEGALRAGVDGEKFPHGQMRVEGGHSGNRMHGKSGGKARVGDLFDTSDQQNR